MEIAPQGQVSTQAPHSTQESSETNAPSSCSSIALQGQVSTQAPHEAHFSLFTFAAM